MSLIDRLILSKVPADTRDDQMREILGNLKRQIPFLYAVLLINLAGLHLATRGLGSPPAPYVVAIGALLMWRLVYWFFLQKPIARIANLERELIRIAFVTAYNVARRRVIWSQHPQLSEIDNERRRQRRY